MMEGSECQEFRFILLSFKGNTQSASNASSLHTKRCDLHQTLITTELKITCIMLASPQPTRTHKACDLHVRKRGSCSG